MKEEGGGDVCVQVQSMRVAASQRLCAEHGTLVASGLSRFVQHKKEGDHPIAGSEGQVPLQGKCLLQLTAYSLIICLLIDVVTTTGRSTRS